MIAHIFAEGDVERLAPLALKSFEAMFASLFSQPTTRSYTLGASNLVEFNRKRQVDFFFLALNSPAFSNLFTNRDYEVIAARMVNVLSTSWFPSFSSPSFIN
jgi:hypothetical protein